MESALFELDTMGILRATKLPPKLEWLNETEILLLIRLLGAGEEGLTRRSLKKLKEPGEDAVTRLNLRDLVKWERDVFGNLTFLVLTWKGEEAAQTLLKVSLHKSKQTPAAPTAA